MRNPTKKTEFFLGGDKCFHSGVGNINIQRNFQQFYVVPMGCERVFAGRALELEEVAGLRLKSEKCKMRRKGRERSGHDDVGAWCRLHLKQKRRRCRLPQLLALFKWKRRRRDGM